MKIKFRPTDDQQRELDEAAAESQDKFFEVRSKMQKEFEDEIENYAKEKADKIVNAKNAKSREAIFSKFKKEHPNLNFDEEYLQENLPPSLVKSFNNGDISAEAYLMKAVGHLKVINAKDESKPKKDNSEENSEEKVDEGDPTKDPNLNDAAGGSNPGEDSEGSDDSEDGFGS